MNPIYICEQGAMIRQKSQTIYVEKKGEKLLQWPLIQIERLCLFGNIQISTQALSLLLDNGIDVAFFSFSGKLRGRLIATESKNVILRLAQYERYLDEAFQLALVRRIVQAKINNSRLFLQRFLSHHPNAPIHEEIKSLLDIFPTLPQQKSVSSLRGCEGIAAAIYFRAFGKLFRNNLQFQQRSRRPPKDPVNALLSLGYTLLTNEMLGLLLANGLDPYIGFLHGIVYGRPSLALDMIEEFRQPVIDRLTLRLFNKNIFQPTDFQNLDEQGCLLQETSLKKYFLHYEKSMRNPTIQGKSIREIMRRQVRRLCESIQHRKEYHPYVLR